VKGYVMELRYPSEANQPPKLFQVIVDKNTFSKSISGTMLAPQSSTIFSGNVPSVAETHANLSQFTLKVVGIMFDADQEWYWTEATRKTNRDGMQIQSLNRMPISTANNSNLSQSTEMPETSPRNSAAPYSDEIPTATASSKPVITYKDRAEYTPEARTAGIEGTIAVNAIFGSDGNIYGARIIRGLPMGLNEEVMKAVQKIKFKPATKNGENVSVRMTMEFSFSTVKDGK
jgi:TonB family protein